MPPTPSVTRAGIDSVNQAASEWNRDDPFGNVKNIIEGNATQRQQRGYKADVCETVIPGNTPIDATVPSLAVQISPNSPGASLNAASNPLVVLVGTTGFKPLLMANPNRGRLTIQNASASGNLFITFGAASNYQTSGVTGANVGNGPYHMKIPAGQTYIDELWTGRIDVISDTGAQCSAFESFKTQQPLS